MTFDVIEVTEEDLKKYSVVQMQLLRNAQKQKNILTTDLALNGKKKTVPQH